MPESKSKTEESPLVLPDVVAYIGTSDWRGISVADWDASNIKGEDRLWSSHNGWQIPVDKFTDDEMAWLTAPEQVGEFVVKPPTMPDLKAAHPGGEVNSL